MSSAQVSSLLVFVLTHDTPGAPFSYFKMHSSGPVSSCTCADQAVCKSSLLGLPLGLRRSSVWLTTSSLHPCCTQLVPVPKQLVHVCEISHLPRALLVNLHHLRGGNILHFHLSSTQMFSYVSCPHLHIFWTHFSTSIINNGWLSRYTRCTGTSSSIIKSPSSETNASMSSPSSI